MTVEEKDKILGIAEVVFLITLGFIRVLSVSTECAWISLVNYIGLVISISGFYIDLDFECSRNPKFTIIRGIFIIVVIIMAILLALIATSVLKLNTLANDLILLITLLVTLPAKFYKQLIKSKLMK